MVRKYPSHVFHPPIRDNSEGGGIRDKLPAKRGVVKCGCGKSFGYITHSETVVCSKCGTEYTA